LTTDWGLIIEALVTVSIMPNFERVKDHLSGFSYVFAQF
jgi:hypothetical protein